MVHVQPVKGRADFGAQDAVFVGLGARVEARMKIRRGVFHRQYSDIARKQPVHGFAQILRRDGIGQVESRHLRQGVDAGVGAARRVDMHRLAFDLREHGFEHALNGRQLRLNLPAVIVRAVVSSG